jgi:cytochrome c biogenesis protein CcdA
MAYAAGAVTILSPCVLPLLPILLGGSLNAHTHGALAMGGGLVASFTATGFLIATLGISMGLTAEVFSRIAAGVMMALGIVLISTYLQEKFTTLAEHATQRLRQGVAHYSPHGFGGQLTLGFLLGAVWTPCVGPTLGAAIALAAQGQQLTYAASVMFVFALGVVTPLVILMLGAREALARRKSWLSRFNAFARPVLGALLFAVGLAILTGWMSEWEAMMLELMPSSLIAFLYRF